MHTYSFVQREILYRMVCKLAIQLCKFLSKMVNSFIIVSTKRGNLVEYRNIGKVQPIRLKLAGSLRYSEVYNW